MDFCSKLFSHLQFNAFGLSVNLSNVDHEQLKRIGHKVAGTLLVTYVSGQIARKIWRHYHVRRKIYEKQAECKDAFKKLALHLTEQELSLVKRDEILKLTFTELQQKLQSGELKAVDVLHAYQSKAIQVNEKLNCVVEPVWEAEEQALSLDLNVNNKKKGPLHGIPVSIKETVHLAGYDSTGGMSCFIGDEIKEDSSVVQALRKQGAVPFMRTNIPQTLVILECSNPIYGCTSNPYNQSKTCGGSSGGEGALIASFGSPLGIGTDIGGSVRTPATLCGICALKPTAERLNSRGQLRVSKGQTAIKVCTGPMARDVDTLVTVMKSLLTPDLFSVLSDRTVTFVPFKEEVYESTKPLTIGYYTHDGVMKCHPTCERAVFMAKAALEKKGYKLVEVHPPGVKRLFYEVYVGLMFAAGFKPLHNILCDDVIDPCIQKIFVWSYYVPAVLKSLIVFLLSFHEPIFAKRLQRMAKGSESVMDYYSVIAEQLDYKDKFHQFWKSNHLDAIICPGIPVPAYNYNTFQRMSDITSYAALYNTIDYPAGTVPITQVTQEDETCFRETYPKSSFLEKIIHKACSDGVGLPVGVQCVGLPFQEEVVLRVMKDIEDNL